MNKLFFVLVVALFPCMSSANQPLDNKTVYCRALGSAFLSAAYFRDLGSNPQFAFDNVRDSFISQSTGKSESGITEKAIKKAVNLVYFDPDFAYAGGFALQQQVEGYCLRDGKPQFQPLK